MDTVKTKAKKEGELFRGDNKTRIEKLKREIEQRKEKIELIEAKTKGVLTNKELMQKHKEVKAQKKLVEFPKTDNVSDDTLAYWKKQQKKGDAKAIAQALDKSLPTIDRALFSGHCKSDEVRDAITKFYKDRNAEGRVGGRFAPKKKD